MKYVLIFLSLLLSFGFPVAPCFSAQACGGEFETVHKFVGTQSYLNIGEMVSGAGDVNLDGFDDVICGAHQGGPNNRGVAYVYSGMDSSLLYEFNGSADSDSFGANARGSGDIDADGYADVIVGDWMEDGNGIRNSGAAYVSF